MEVNTEGSQPDVNDTKAPEPESGWITMIPKDIAAEKTDLFSQYDGFNEFVSDAVSKMERFGDLEGQLKNAVVIPESDDWSEVWSKLGKPADVKDYGIEEQEIADVFFNANLTKDQARMLAEGLGNIPQPTDEEVTKQREEQYMKTLSSLKEKYGDEVEAKLSGAKSAIQNLGGEELVSMLSEKGLDNDPAMLDFFINLGGLMEEGHIPIGHQLRPKSKGLVGMYKSMDGMT